MSCSIKWLSLFLGLLFVTTPFFASDSELQAKRQRVIEEARYLLERGDISYRYGGHKIGDKGECGRCNQCLASISNKNSGINRCEVCQSCTLDCSHFAILVFNRAGLRTPYLHTEYMIRLSEKKLVKLYDLRDIGSDVKRALPGDLLVYHGHVVILERSYSFEGKRGDIIHATSGREIRGPAMGIQRARNVDLANFKGRLQRVLRHRDIWLLDNIIDKNKPKKRLRPIKLKTHAKKWQE